jgi:predicted metal-dependent phosphoesterase TrpH
MVYSEDATLTPDELILQAKAAGLDGICLTEHDWFWDAEQAATLAKKHKFLVLPGVEVNTEEGHVLVYGLHRYAFGMHRPLTLKRFVDEAGGAMLASHPYRRFFSLGEREFGPGLGRARSSTLLRIVHGVEQVNGRGTVLQNEFSGELAARFSLPTIAASDAHSQGDVGRVATLFEREVSSLGHLIQELKAGRFRPAFLEARHG